MGLGEMLPNRRNALLYTIIHGVNWVLNALKQRHMAYTLDVLTFAFSEKLPISQYLNTTILQYLSNKLIRVQFRSTKLPTVVNIDTQIFGSFLARVEKPTRRQAEPELYI